MCEMIWNIRLVGMVGQNIIIDSYLDKYLYCAFLMKWRVLVMKKRAEV